jgi:hypothetical protein
MTCCICFDETDFYTCILCDSNTCKECCENFIESSNTLPICPKENCDQYYIFNKNIINNYHDKYIDLIFKFLQNENIDTLTVMKHNKNLINEIRNSRLDFIKSTKLPAILAFINIALQDKLKKVDKKNLKFIETINKDTIKCYNTFCDRGILNKDLKCNLCLTTFCETCKEKKIKPHKCDEKILNSLKLMETFTKCPKCLVLVEKKDGCNAITCAICKTNFDYISGDISPFSNHGKSIYFDLKENYKLSQEYSDVYPKNIIKLLHDIEYLKPMLPDFNKIIKYLDKLLCKDEIKKEKLCKLYYNYNIQNKNMKNYYNYIEKIGNHHKNKTLTCEILQEIIQNLN